MARPASTIPARMAYVLDMVIDEVHRARERFGEGSLSGIELTDEERYPILMEEAGEVAEALVMAMQDGRFAEGREHHKTNLQLELVQLSAAALGWAWHLEEEKREEEQRGG